MSNPIDALQAARAATTELTASEQRLRDEHGEAVRAVSDVRNAWPPADEIVDNMRRLIRDKSERVADERQRAIIRAFAGDSELKVSGKRHEVRPALPWFQEDMNRITLPMLIMLAPEVVRASFERIIRAHAPAEGIPAVERAARVRDAEARVRAIEDQHEQLVDEAAAVGIALRHLPAVQQRREETAAQALLKQASTDARRDVEQSVNTMRGYSQVERTQDADIASPWSNG